MLMKVLIRFSHFAPNYVVTQDREEPASMKIRWGVLPPTPTPTLKKHTYLGDNMSSYISCIIPKLFSKATISQ
jgi:hypothetical protein